jgi:hypothetical protein
MALTSFRVHRSPCAQRLTIELNGEIDEDAALSCERETRAQLAATAERSLHVLWDLSRLTDYSLAARAAIVRLQCFLTGKAQRTAYVAPHAMTRSLALWTARMGNQSQACIAADRDAADLWLAGGAAPELIATPAPIATPRPKNTAAG